MYTFRDRILKTKIFHWYFLNDVITHVGLPQLYRELFDSTYIKYAKSIFFSRFSLRHYLPNALKNFQKRHNFILLILQNILMKPSRKAKPTNLFNSFNRQPTKWSNILKKGLRSRKIRNIFQHLRHMKN